MFKIHHRGKSSCFCQIIGIFLDLTDIADKDPGKKFFADIRGYDLFSLLDLVIIIFQMDKLKFSLIDQTEISRHDTAV